MAETTATRSAALALADERALMRQGYQFLDEKRMLLASEMLRTLAEHRAIEARLREGLHEGRAALRRALHRHGLEGLQSYPPAPEAPLMPPPRRSMFLGVALLAARPVTLAARVDDTAVDASPEAQACRDHFTQLLDLLVRLAACAGNLERLGAEYRRTERRARALENVLLPEIETSLRRIDEHLELADQEEAVRIRQVVRHR